MKKEKIISLAIICGTIIIASFMLTKVNFYIQGWNTNNSIENTISVQWDGKVFVTPDILTLSINVEETKSTTAEAQKEVNKKVNQIKEIIKNYKIKNSDVQSKNINVYPEYDYRDSGRKLLWYRASHNLDIKIKWANLENEWVGWKLIDEISNIWWVIINNINYDIEDKTPYYTQARELAMEKANQKAKELAKVAGVKLLKPISISESIDTYYPTPMYRNTYAMDMWMWAKAESAEVSLWELEINLNINVLYWIQ